jgi:VanZ family protein
VVYASLHPFAGWADTGVGLFEFLAAPWPRYYTNLDLLFNGLAYLPLGLLLMAALLPRLKPGSAVVVATMAGVLLSLTMEVLQHFLPSRVPSNVDLGLNGLGSLAGALLGVRFGRAFADHGALARWRARRIIGGHLGDAGLVLMLAWLLTQLNPEILLFGNGDLRSLLDLRATLAFTAARHVVVEQAVAATGLIAAGVIFWQLMRARSLWLLATVLVLTVATKTLGTLLLVEPYEPGHWITEGNLEGLAIGTVLLLPALLLPRQAQTTVAALALLAGTALVNLAPENPYLADTLARWNQGHFLNFNGLTRLASILWPFFALALLLAINAPREPPLPQGTNRSP